MNAAEFNKLYDEIISNRLLAMGFKKSGKSLFLDINGVYFAIIRSSYRGLQFTYITLCLRHSFVRDLWDKVDNLFATSPNDYPFKIRPFELTESNLENWHYEANFVGMGYNGEIFNYGDNEFLFGTVEDITYKLEALYHKITTLGVKWISKLINPQEAYNQLLKYHEGSATELVWLEDYKKYLSNLESEKEIKE